MTSVVTVCYLVGNYCISLRSRAVADHSGLLVQVTVCDYEYDDYFIPDGCKNCGLHYCQRDHAELHFYCILWRKYVHGVASMTERLCWLTWLCWDGWSSLSCAVISWTECLFASGRNKSFVSVHIANFVMMATVLKWRCSPVYNARGCRVCNFTFPNLIYYSPSTNHQVAFHYKHLGYQSLWRITITIR